MYGASGSFNAKSVKDGNFWFHNLSGGVECVSFASHRGDSNKTRWQVQDSVQMLTTYWFHDVSSSHSFPINIIFSVIRTRHCRLRRSCIEGSSGSVGFKTAV